jgi:hypothetical protein
MLLLKFRHAFRSEFLESSLKETTFQKQVIRGTLSGKHLRTLRIAIYNFQLLGLCSTVAAE